MKIKLGDLVGVHEQVQTFLNTKMKPSAMFALARKIRPVMEAYETYDKIRARVLDDLGIRNDKGGYDIPACNRDAFASAMQDLVDTEVEVDAPLIPMDVLENALEDNLAPMTLIRLQMAGLLDSEAPAPA